MLEGINMVKAKEDINFKRIGKHLKEIRNKAGETRAVTSTAIDISEGSLRNIENGYAISLFRIVQLCEHFEVPLETVLYDCTTEFEKMDMPMFSKVRSTKGINDCNTKDKSTLEELVDVAGMLPDSAIRILIASARSMKEEKIR